MYLFLSLEDASVLVHYTGVNHSACGAVGNREVGVDPGIRNRRDLWFPKGITMNCIVIET